MKPRQQNISRRVTQSMTRVHLSSPPIPDELFFEIFSRLPSNSIARCRCVSKIWFSMLRSQYFTELFLIKSRNRPQLLFLCEDDREVSFISSPQPENPEANSSVVASNHLASFPIREFGLTSGFLCYGANLMLNCCQDEKIISNPSTGQSFTLPRLNSERKGGFLVDTHHGYDPVSKEFKVLSMVSSCESDGVFTSVDHQVLTLGTKRLSWRMVDCCIPHCPSGERICINGVLYYIATSGKSVVGSMVVCFDLRSEKFSFIKFMESSKRALFDSTTMVDYNGKLGLLTPGESSGVFRSTKSFELWVVRDAAKHEWSKHVYRVPPSWKYVVSEVMCIAGMVGTSEIVLTPIYQYTPSYVIYYNVESKRIRKVWIQGMEAFHGKKFRTYVNYVENVKLL